MATAALESPAQQNRNGTAGKRKLFDLDQILGKIYSNGWMDGDALVDVVEPATGATLATVGLVSAATVAKAAQSALKAQKQWALVPPEEKRKLFIRAESGNARICGRVYRVDRPGSRRAALESPF